MEWTVSIERTLEHRTSLLAEQYPNDLEVGFVYIALCIRLLAIFSKIEPSKYPQYILLPHPPVLRPE